MQDAMDSLTEGDRALVVKFLRSGDRVAAKLEVVLQTQDSQSAAVKFLMQEVDLDPFTASSLVKAAYPGTSDSAPTRLPCSRNRVHTDAARAARSSFSGELRH